MEKQFAAGGVVIKRNGKDLRVLLIKDGYGHWTWPKGHIERGETPELAAVREVGEETGLKNCRILQEIGRQEYYFTLGSKRIFKTVHIYLMELTGEDKLIVQTAEIQEAAWFGEKEALDKVEYPGSRELVEKGIRIFREKYC
ncbi:MAG: NUDIX hydrolase [Candidatus Omnitrophica bacterium]|nr:NUDIX hydrolase [Candidatus Omnitrophota bacterium]